MKTPDQLSPTFAVGLADGKGQVLSIVRAGFSDPFMFKLMVYGDDTKLVAEGDSPRRLADFAHGTGAKEVRFDYDLTLY